MSKVIVIGGGVAGMSAAHELAERGFQVEIFERNPRYVGGKSRSVDAPGTNQIDPTLFLPGEHGFRFFPGFYKHVTDTMKRIPVGRGRSAFDNLVPTQSVVMTRSHFKPIEMPVNFPTSLKDLVQCFKVFQSWSDELSDEEIAFFAGKVWQLMTSCSQRFEHEYDNISWWDYTEAASKSAAYQHLLAGGLSRTLVACKAQTASTRTCGTKFIQMLYMMMDPFAPGTDRVLNAPTDVAWMRPWLNYLNTNGVQYHQGARVTHIGMEGRRISSIRYEQGGRSLQAGSRDDHFVLAVPVEQAANLMNADILAVAPALQNVISLAPNVEWMNGIQFYLNAKVSINYGHTMYTGSNWALTSISQKQFWPHYDLSRRGNGKVVSILSVDVSNWVAAGNFNGKAAQDCTKDEIRQEVWSQLKQGLNVDGKVVLHDDMVEGYYLDEDIEPLEQTPSPSMAACLSTQQCEHMHKMVNLEPLLVNQCNTWGIRPNAHTGIKNLYLASDYVKTHTDLATMEAANEAARRAVNCILAAEDSDEDYCEVWEAHTPLLLKPLQALDHLNFEKGLPWREPM